jgi:hypothetical protein
MGKRTIAVLNPTARPKAKDISSASRIRDLNGKVIGFLWNNKPNGDLLLGSIEKLLLERFQLSGVKWYQKQVLANSADAGIIEELALTSDLVVSAISD